MTYVISGSNGAGYYGRDMEWHTVCRGQRDGNVMVVTYNDIRCERIDGANTVSGTYNDIRHTWVKRGGILWEEN